MKQSYSIFIKTISRFKLFIFLVFSMTLKAHIVVAENSNLNYQAVPGEYIVGFKKDIQFLDQKELTNNLGSYIKSQIKKFNLVVIKRPIFERSDSVIQTLLENPEVEFVEPNFIYKEARIPTDTNFENQWALENTGQVDNKGQIGFSGMDINAIPAWNRQVGSKNTIVAIVDSGINYNHPDLVSNMWVNRSEASGRAGIDDDNNGVVDDIYGFNTINKSGNPLDDQTHGTFCAGLIGAKGNNGVGITGVNWNVSLMAIKFTDRNGSGSTENAILGIDYALRMGAHIISNSWGSTAYSIALEKAVERTAQAGVVFVAAAGNLGSNTDQRPFYPASYKFNNVISVASVDNRGQIASGSNYGKNSVHVAAPGVNLLSTSRASYSYNSGTSFAAPIVAGVAALLKSQSPLLNGSQIRTRIMNRSNKLPQLNSRIISGGLVDAAATIN